jgi:hypothetical protein
MEWSIVWVSTKPLITEEIWPGRGSNPGLDNETLALYPPNYKLHNFFFLPHTYYVDDNSLKVRFKNDN